MSVIVIGHMSVDPGIVQKMWAERAADFAAIAEEARAQGCVHHRWGIGDGVMVLVDEWPDAESFQQFFSGQPKIAELMAAAGVSGPPTFEILATATGAPDEF